ncbi:MAG: ATP phosphoribosyltransferase regulatory subunit [Spirochaetaceae bacterium]
MKEKLLRTPQGAESIFLDEAYKHEKINEVINNIYTHRGYLPIKTPVFDYYETYEKLLSTESKKNCFRLMDRDGELLLLRNDITLFLARQIGRVVKKNDTPLRVHYADTILRHQSAIDISSNEFFQSGAELVGCSGLFGDLEIITLLNTIITELDPINTRIHIGSRSILDGITSKFPTIDTDKLITLINLRDITSFTEYLTPIVGEKLADKISGLFLFIGTYTEFCDYTLLEKDLLKQLDIINEIDYLKEIGKNLVDLEMIQNFRFDLSEVANRSYYTGIVFKAYTKDIDSAIASGGRYDNLISCFGEKLPSVGFSIMLRKIEKQLKDERFNPPKMIEINSGTDFVKAFKEAELLRKDGKAAVLKGDN